MLTTSRFVDRIEAHFDAHGWGLWAVEVGWRLAKESWGNGYATEAARAAVDDGFDRLGLDEIVSFTAVDNIRSQRVMQKIGMTRNPAEDFDHPNIPVGHPLCRHVLYRITAS